MIFYLLRWGGYWKSGSSHHRLFDFPIQHFPVVFQKYKHSSIGGRGCRGGCRGGVGKNVLFYVKKNIYIK